MNELEGSRMFVNLSRRRDRPLPGRFGMDYVWMTRPVQIWQPVQIWHDRGNKTTCFSLSGVSSKKPGGWDFGGVCVCNSSAYVPFCGIHICINIYIYQRVIWYPWHRIQHSFSCSSVAQCTSLFSFFLYTLSWLMLFLFPRQRLQLQPLSGPIRGGGGVPGNEGLAHLQAAGWDAEPGLHSGLLPAFRHHPASGHRHGQIWAQEAKAAWQVIGHWDHTPAVIGRFIWLRQ